MKNVLFLIMLFSVHMSSSAQNITGKVLDPNQTPMEMANVVLLRAQDSLFIQGTISKEDGTFHLAGNGKDRYILKISSVGYTTVYTSCSPGTENTVILTPDVIHLDEALVTAQKQLFKTERGAIVADIAHSILSKETSITDVIRKIPGMTLHDDKPVSFIGGDPLIYINGKKAMDYSAVKNIPVKEIKTIKLITNPGAEYDASTGAVLLITTKKTLKGLSVQLDGNIRKNHFWTHSEALNLNYGFKKLTLFATLEYEDDRRKSIETAHLINQGTDRYENYIDARGRKNSDKTINYSLGFNYQINDNHQFGVEYSGWTEKYRDLSSINDSTLKNSLIYDRVLSLSDIKDKKIMNHANIFYGGRLAEKLSLHFYGDYLNNHPKRNQMVDENADLTGSATIRSISKSTYNIYAVKGIFDYDLTPKQGINWGAEYSRTKGNASLHYSDELNNSDYNTEENKIAVFAEYSLDFKPFSLNAGLRYEHVSADQTDFLDAANNISRNYSNLFPDLTITYGDKSVNQSLSYRSAVQRPSFSWLSTASTYVNRYQRQIGNPALWPQISHTVQYSLMYKFLFIQAGYTYNKDFMGLMLLQDGKNEAVTLSSWTNYDHEQVLSLVAGIRYKWKFYEPSLTLGVQKHFLEIEYLGEKKDLNKPMAMVDINNGLHLPGGIYANLEYIYTSSGNSQFITIKPIHFFNVTLQKSLCKDKLTLTLKATDLFAKNVTRIYGGIDKVYINQFIDRDKRAVSFHLTWRFNSNSKSYKGKNAAREEMNRLD